MKHTPGPWMVEPHSDDHDGALNVVSGYEARGNKRIANWIAECDLQEDDRPEENAANARLIAVAPDLLAALKAVVETGDDCPACDRGVLRRPENGHWPVCPFGRALATIAKLTTP